MELSQYLDIFLEESKEHLQNLNEKLLLLEQDGQNVDLVNEIFRSAHTLKGMSATMGYENMATLTHEMENLLDLVRTNKKVVETNFIDTIFHSVDLLEQMIVAISNGGDDNFDISGIVNQLKDISSGKSQNNKIKKTKKEDEILNKLTFDEYEMTVLKQSVNSGFSVYQILVNIEEETVLKSARVFMVFHQLEQHGEILKSNPTVEQLENEEFSEYFYVALISKSDQEQIENVILNISEITNVEISEISIEQLEDNPMQNISDTSNEIVHKELYNVKNAHHNFSSSGKMIRVDIERLDELMNLFSELVIDRGRLEQLSSELKHSGLADTVEHMSRISSSLQNNILNLRMVPIEQVFNRFPRMIRDLSKELDKKVNFNISGADTELDRTVIDEIGDPLVHLLRNAVDHGLESVNERLNKGKTEIGEISLKAFHSGNNVFIEIKDDGKGINPKKILKKAIEKEIVSEEAGQSLTKKQIYELLFTSGFSTTNQVSDISGRGVGLDVAKTKVEALGGYISVESELEKGTIFTIQLPLTLSIISSMLVKVQNEKYAIPLSSIIETAIYKKEKIMFAHNQEVIDFRGHVVPLVDLIKIFDIPITDEENQNDEVSVVLVRKRDKVAGLIVDSFIGQQEIVLKSLGSYLSQVFAISGATILGDGQVALIIDTNALIK